MPSPRALFSRAGSLKARRGKLASSSALIPCDVLSVSLNWETPAIQRAQLLGLGRGAGRGFLGWAIWGMTHDKQNVVDSEGKLPIALTLRF